MGDTSMSDLQRGIDAMELDHAEDTFCENIAELWACIDKLLQFESDDSGYGFNAYFEHVSETNWVKSQTLTYKRLQIFGFKK